MKFKEIFKLYEDMDPEDYTRVLESKRDIIIHYINDYKNDPDDGEDAFLRLVFAALAVDGKISQDEYEKCYPLLKTFYGTHFRYNEKVESVREYIKNGLDYDAIKDGVTNLLVNLPEEIRGDLIIVALIICSVDGKISLREKKWIEDLYDALPPSHI